MNTPRPIRTVAIVSTGSEILQGLYADTNAQWLAQQCTALGLDVVAIIAAPDDMDHLRRTFGHASSRADLVISSGGLGPTEDDLNRWVFKDIWQVELAEDHEAVELMRKRFADRGRTMPESNRVQALVPLGCKVFQNAHGTAPGFYLEASEQRPALVALPGPPREMKPMFTDQVLPLIKRHLHGQVYSSLRVIHVFGQPESAVNEAIQPVFRWNQQVQVGILARNYGIDLRILARSNSAEETQALIAETEARIRAAVPEEWIYGCDEDTMPAKVMELLRERRVRLATAESCTGGLVAKLITDLPGSSAVFTQGLVTYSNESKMRWLGVGPELLDGPGAPGAVSQEVAEAMVRGLAERTEAEICLSVTGIAGPDGGTATKPVGLVFVGLSVFGQVTVHQFKLVTDREMNRNLAALSALDLARRALLRVGKT
jgi:nicotinamide-nucleotide amidase